MAKAVICPICDGKGKIGDLHNSCHGCNGKGWVEVDDYDQVPVPYYVQLQYSLSSPLLPIERMVWY